MALFRPVLVDGRTPIPLFIYGTAWKNERTDVLVTAALQAGFRAVDSASQSHNYNEALVGKSLQSWANAAKSCQNPAEELRRIFVQSKFTPAAGFKDGAMPFDEDDSPVMQVSKSIEACVAHLGNDHHPLDAWLLHSPFATIDETMGYWHAMELCVPKHVTHLGICNVSLQTLKDVYDRAKVKPVIVQNDFRPAHGFDMKLLDFCKDHGIVYQAYAVLKGNISLLSSPIVRWLAHEKGITEPQALYCLVLSCWDGYMCILNGTTCEVTMRQDLDLLHTVGKLDDFIIDGFRRALEADEGNVWPSDKSG